jgi:thiol-disulfide isomerase/thioredoxin
VATALRSLARPAAVAAWPVAVLLLAAGLAGCGDAGVTPPPAESRIDVDTPQLRSAKAAARIADCPSPRGEGSDLPDLTLPCLGGGRQVRLADVSGPAVIPLWASWCEPCKEELPLFQRLARASGDELTVLGVNYQDTQPDLAIELLDQTGAEFPQLADPAGVLADEYRVRGLPGVLWVSEDGSASFANTRVRDYQELLDAVASELDVTLPAAG